jgi:hypothetical protein
MTLILSHFVVVSRDSEGDTGFEARLGIGRKLKKL